MAKLFYKSKSKLRCQRFRRPGFIILLGLFVLLYGHYRAFAQEKLEIKADRLAIDNKARKAHFTGHVQAQQKGLSLASQELELFYEENSAKIKQLTAWREVAIKLDLNGQEVFISAKRAVFMPYRDIIVISGPNLLLRKGKDEARACRLVLERRSSKLTFEGCGKDRVWLKLNE